jgi:hypothetical protein
MKEEGKPDSAEIQVEAQQHCISTSAFEYFLACMTDPDHCRLTRRLGPYV